MQTDTADTKQELISSVDNSSMSLRAKSLLPDAHGYYRSKLFISTNSVNPLAAASAALLALATKLRTLPEYDDLPGLQTQFIHEIKSFESNAQNANYRTDSILVARYIICAAIDETIAKTTWENREEWQKLSLLAYFHEENWGGKRVFQILKRISQDADVHIDLLELIYLCLSLGFEGDYNRSFQDDNNNLFLETIINDLYQTIRRHRGHVSKKLLIGASTTPKANRYQQPSPKRKTPLLSLTLLAFGVIGLLIVGSNYLIGIAAKPFYQSTQTLIQNTDNANSS